MYMFKRAVLTALLLLSLGVGGFMFWAFGLPKLNQKTANEALIDIPGASAVDQPAEERLTINRQSLFVGREGHEASGTVTLLSAGERRYLRLESDFSVTNGPDLFIGFGTKEKVDEATLFSRLKANAGGQNYEIPPTVDVDNYDTVYIYCRAFSTDFAVATFE